MIPTEIAAAVLLCIGVLGCAYSSLGILLSRDVYDQMHYLAPASIAGCICFPAAVLLHEGWTQAGEKSILIALLLLAANPVLTHATARAARVRRNQQADVKPGERIPFAKESDD